MNALKARLWRALLLLLLATQALAATFIYHHAGSWINGFSGDGGPAFTAQFNIPYGLYLSPAGDLYVGDIYNYRVRKIDAATGLISTVAGAGSYGFGGDGGPAVNAQLGYVYDMGQDSAGNLYLVDSIHGMVRRVDAATGVISTVAGTGLLGYSGDGGPAVNASFNDPKGLAVDPAGNLYISCFASHVIRKVDAATGIVTTVAGTGTSGYSGDGGPATAARLSFPVHIALDAAGDLVIADRGNSRIRKLDTVTGIISTIAGSGAFGYGGDGGPALAASFAQPFAAEYDAAGNLYIADSFNQRVRKVDAVTGLVSTWAGTGTLGYSGDGGPALAAQLKNPYELAVAPNGDVFVSDTLNYVVRLISAERTPTPTLTVTLTPLPTLTPTPTASPTQTLTPPPTATALPTPPPLSLCVLPANPNPSSQAVWLPFCLGTAASVELQVYTLAGEPVRALSPSAWPQGNGELRWDLRNQAGQGVSSGIYLYRLRARSPAGEELGAWGKCAVVR